MLGQSIKLEEERVQDEQESIFTFLARYYKQLNSVNLSKVDLDTKYLRDRFCEINKVPKKLFAWNSNDVAKLNEMDDQTLYQSILTAFKSILKEWI